MLEVAVACGGSAHRIRYRPAHALELLGHEGDRDADDVLVALTGE